MLPFQNWVDWADIPGVDPFGSEARVDQPVGVHCTAVGVEEVELFQVLVLRTAAGE